MAGGGARATGASRRVAAGRHVRGAAGAVERAPAAELVPVCRARSVHRTSSARTYELVVGARRWPDGRWRPCAWASCVSAGRWRRPAAETRRSMHRQPVVTGSRAHRVAGVRQGRCPHAPGCGAHIRQVAAPTRAGARCPHAPGCGAHTRRVRRPRASGCGGHRRRRCAIEHTEPRCAARAPSVSRAPSARRFTARAAARRSHRSSCGVLVTTRRPPSARRAPRTVPLLPRVPKRARAVPPRCALGERVDAARHAIPIKNA